MHRSLIFSKKKCIAIGITQIYTGNERKILLFSSINSTVFSLQWCRYPASNHIALKYVTYKYDEDSSSFADVTNYDIYSLVEFSHLVLIPYDD